MRRARKKPLQWITNNVEGIKNAKQFLLELVNRIATRVQSVDSVFNDEAVEKSLTEFLELYNPFTIRASLVQSLLKLLSLLKNPDSKKEDVLKSTRDVAYLIGNVMWEDIEIHLTLLNNY
jgi:hypothetical protein